MTYKEAQKVQEGDVIRSKIGLKHASRLVVTAGCQGIVQKATKYPKKGCYSFVVKWNLTSGDSITLSIDSPDVDRVPNQVRC